MRRESGKEPRSPRTIGKAKGPSGKTTGPKAPNGPNPMGPGNRCTRRKGLVGGRSQERKGTCRPMDPMAAMIGRLHMIGKNMTGKTLKKPENIKPPPPRGRIQLHIHLIHIAHLSGWPKIPAANKAETPKPKPFRPPVRPVARWNNLPWTRW